MARGRTICLPGAIDDGSPRTPLTETCLSMRTSSGCRNLREYRFTLTYDSASGNLRSGTAGHCPDSKLSPALAARCRR